MTAEGAGGVTVKFFWSQNKGTKLVTQCRVQYITIDNY